MRIWKRELSLRENTDRVVLHLGRVITRRARMRYEQLPTVDVGIEHLEGARLVPDRRALLDLFPKGAVGAELGVDNGEFSALLVEVCQPRLLHLVDPWSTKRYGDQKHDAVRTMFASELSAGQVAMHRATSLQALHELPDASLDWVYIDSDHTYATTKAELLALERKVKPDGLIAGHDYVTGNWFGSYRFGVVEAVNEFCVQRGWRFVGLTHETDRHLSFALRRLDERT